MIGIDTNVLVRHLTQDEPAQAATVSRLIDKAPAAGLFVSVIVLCETIWVLSDVYGLKRKQLEDVLEKILLSEQFACESKDALWLALDDFRSGKGDFSDYVIARIAHSAGCDHTVTFDRALKKDRLFHVL
ncbi:MAG: type II toxin-antitoxin system VapC family toxin [Tepidisphaeraceae bacterium]